MKFTLAVFKSRTDTMRFYNIIKKYNGFCSIINTPHTLSRSCGISVKISGANISIAKNIIASNRFDSFVGIYDIIIINGKENSTKLY